ncbi:transcriptional repressor LexA [Burkholderiales bacterium]|jgi:repressor LexA|nr:transcriptional repressor LexA [Betaproteobacteria bacterium]MDC1433294.1 transcriptional repressor LexA [Burkholderiales bacterium]MDC3408535.1 transcriptional repressor LexA [Burkholderiales bacterium]MDG1163228.1 transcriptional repressor LexA [Burkholderiales bacterium]MDG2203502.1 transcriptional repressor LexA [Burkholderiales bacterium]
MKPLTQRQAEILKLIQSFVEDTGFPPTRSDIARALNFKSTNAAEDHLRALERKGHIKIARGTSRGIQLLKNSGLPVVGRVAAGQPILSEEHIQTRVQVEQSLFKPAADYLLKVKGSSMRDIGIQDGDLLAVHASKEARSGQVIVARINQEVTVKRLKRKNKEIWLEAENPDFSNISINGERDEFAIEGIAVGIIRNGKIS